MEAFLESDIEDIVIRLGDLRAELSGKTLVLTGARGFLGRYFIEVFNALNRDYLKEPLTVIALDNLITAGSAGARFPQYEHIKFINADVTQEFQYDGPVHFVIHAAGIASPYYYRAFPLQTLEVSTVGTRRMLELADANRARFVFFSSSEIYGDPDSKHVPIPESYRGNVSCQGPRACYDESKRLGETLCYIYHGTRGTHTNTIRPFNVFGPGMQESDYRVLPNFASNIKSGATLKVYGNGNQTRTFCYITDAMIGFLMVILKGYPGEAYNIGNPTPEISMVELVGRCATVLNHEIPHEIVEYPDSYPADEPNRRAPNITKARLQLGFEPKVGLDEGLGRFLRWADAVYTGNP